MKPKNHDLHGSAPDTSSTVLLLVDVISDFEFQDGKALFERALPTAKKVRLLKSALTQKGISTIYANDNFGKWRSDLKALVHRCTNRKVRGSPIAKLLRPLKSDYFVLKPKHSAFFATTLDTLLEYLEVKRLIIAGWATNSCVLFTANEAYMRDFEILIPSDCTAALTDADEEYALSHFRQVLKAKVLPSEEVVKIIKGGGKNA